MYMQNYYKYLIWVGTATLVLLSFFLVAKTKQVLNTATTTNTVSFSGEGKVLAKPDVAVTFLSMVTEATTSKEAQDENSKKSNQVVEFLENADIDEKDIKTTSYNISPIYNYSRLREPEITGYRVNQSLEVKIRDLDKASEIIDGVVAAGVNQVGNLSFQIDDPEKLQSQAREMAIKDAKNNAGELKKQLGIKLGRIINFSENTGGYIPLPIRSFDEAGIGGGGPSLPTGENEIIVNVTLTYQIK